MRRQRGGLRRARVLTERPINMGKISSASLLSAISTDIKVRPELTTLMSKYGLTEGGAYSLIQLLDAFHDNEHKLTGLCDMNRSATYRFVQRDTQTISAPAAVTWDAHIHTNPELMYAATGYVFAQGADGEITYDDSKQNIKTSTFNIITVATGEKTVPDNTGVFAPTNYTSYVYPTTNTSLESGLVRCIGMAFEVHNISAPLYQQGSVITYRQGQRTGHVVPPYVAESSDAKQGYPVLISSTAAPSVESIVSKNPTAKSWSAKDGCYCIAVQNPFDNDFTIAEHGLRAYYAKNGEGLVYGYLASPDDISNTNLTWHPTPFDTVGAYFTGLDANAKLKVTMIRYMEMIPDNTSANMPLAQPATGYDPVALDIYAKIAPLLPSGVPVSMNAKGDWWRFIAGALKNVLPTVERALPFVAQGIDVMTGTPIGTNALNLVNNLSNQVKGMRKQVQAIQKKKQVKKA